MLEKTKRFIRECGRVLKLTKKPTKEEFWAVVKVSALGILVIGAIGFLDFYLKILITTS